jgi:acyl-CoA thioester hydrolase
MASPVPAVHSSTHRVKFSDLDPYRHMRTARYAAYFVDHRLDALREQAGWDLATLETLPFMTFVRRLDIEFVRPVVGDQRIVIESSVREFAGPDAHIECTLSTADGAVAARCRMVVAYVDRATRRGADWPADVQAPFFVRGPE